MRSTVSLSIKGVPVALVEALKQRAARHQRSLQGELMSLIEVAAAEVAEDRQKPAPWRTATVSSPVLAREAATPRRAQRAMASSLLAELDALVEGSRLGAAPLLTREQANDRRLAREFEFDARQ